MSGKVYIPICAYPEQNVQELRDAMSPLDMEVMEVDAGARGSGGLSPEDVKALVQTLSGAYDQIFGNFKVLDFVRDYAIGAVVMEPVRRYFSWIAKQWNPEVKRWPIEIDLGETIGIKLRITLEGAPNESFDDKLNTLIEKEVSEKLMSGNSSQVTTYLRWNASKDELVKESAIQVEGLEKLRQKVHDGLNFTNKS